MRIRNMLSLVPMIALMSCGKGEVVDVSDTTELYFDGLDAQGSTGYSQIIQDSARMESEWGQDVPVAPLSSSVILVSSSSTVTPPLSSSTVFPPSSSSGFVPPSSSSIFVPPSSSSTFIPPSSSSSVIRPSSSSTIVPPSSSSAIVPPSSSSAVVPPSSGSTGGPVTLSAWDTFASIPTGTSNITLAVTAPGYYTGTSATFRCERAAGAQTQVTGSLVVGAQTFSLNDWSPAPANVPLTGTGTITTDQPISCKLGH